MTTAEFVASADNRVLTTFKDLNLGSDTIMYMGPDYSGGSKTVLHRTIGNFDLSSIVGATVTAAKMQRYMDFLVASAGGFAATINRCTRPSTWTENGCTWNKYDGTTVWTAEGGDFSSSPVAPVSFTEDTGSGLKEVTGLGALCQDALDNRSGILSVIMKAVSESPGSASVSGWYSKEYSDSAKRWRVVVEYTDAPVAATATGRRTSAGNYMGEHRPRAPRAASSGRRPVRPPTGGSR